MMLQTHFLDQWGHALRIVLSVVDRSLSAHLFVMFWKTLTCGHWIALTPRGWAILKLTECTQIGIRPMICPDEQQPMEWPCPALSSMGQAFLNGNLKPPLVLCWERPCLKDEQASYIQTRRKYWQVIYLTNALYEDYLKTFQNSTNSTKANK